MGHGPRLASAVSYVRRGWKLGSPPACTTRPPRPAGPPSAGRPQLAAFTAAGKPGHVCVGGAVGVVGCAPRTVDGRRQRSSEGCARCARLTTSQQTSRRCARCSTCSSMTKAALAVVDDADGWRQQQHLWRAYRRAAHHAPAGPCTGRTAVCSERLCSAGALRRTSKASLACALHGALRWWHGGLLLSRPNPVPGQGVTLVPCTLCLLLAVAVRPSMTRERPLQAKHKQRVMSCVAAAVGTCGLRCSAGAGGSSLLVVRAVGLHTRPQGLLGTRALPLLSSASSTGLAYHTSMLVAADGSPCACTPCSTNTGRWQHTGAVL